MAAAIGLGEFLAAQAGVDLPRYAYIIGAGVTALLAIVGLAMIVIGVVVGSPPSPSPLAERDADAVLEIGIGRRAIRLSRLVRPAYFKAIAEVDRVQRDPNAEIDYLWEERIQLHDLRLAYGDQWADLIRSLESRGFAVSLGAKHALCVNLTGLDDYAGELEAMGVQILRSHGVDPDSV